MQFGSHLYGLNTPTSDIDIKGIFLPTREQILLGNIPRQVTISSGPKDRKNSATDSDIAYYSLHYFIKLALEGQTVAIDMLHSDKRHWLQSSTIWESLVRNRRAFYSKNLAAFMGYIKTQAAKYGIKGSRLDAAKEVVAFLRSKDEAKLEKYWDLLWENEYCSKQFNGTHRIWEVCGKKLTETAKCSFAIEILELFITRYGDRAKLAALNQGIDWKAVSHALRAGYEVLSILRHKTFAFPLPESDYLRKVKAGEYDYLTNVAPTLEQLVETITKEVEKSDLPKHPDKEFVDNWLIKTLESTYFKL